MESQERGVNIGLTDIGFGIRGRSLRPVNELDTLNSLPSPQPIIHFVNHCNDAVPSLFLSREMSYTFQGLSKRYESWQPQKKKKKEKGVYKRKKNENEKSWVSN